MWCAGPPMTRPPLVAKFQIKINIMQISPIAIILDIVAGRCRSQTIPTPTKDRRTKDLRRFEVLAFSATQIPVARIRTWE